MKRMAAVSVLLLLFWLIGCDGRRQQLRLVVSTEEPAPSIATAIRNVLQDRIDIEIRPLDGSQDIADTLRNGGGDLAIIEEPTQTMFGLSTLVPLYPSILHVLYKGGDQPANLGEVIAGKAVYAGPMAGTASKLLAALSSDYELSSPYQLLDNPWETSPDVYFILGGLLPRESWSQLTGYSLYSFGDAEKVGKGTGAEGLSLLHGNLRPFILPIAIYGTLSPQPVLTLSTRTVLTAREDLTPETAQLITSRLLERANKLAVAYPLVSEQLNERFDPYTLTFPLHPGSRDYLERNEPSFIEQYADVVGVLMAIVASIGSAGLALYRQNRARQKNRIDIFYLQLVDVRQSMRDGEEAASRSELASRVERLQEEVFDQVARERIAADASLIAFIDLSNQVLRELTGSEREA